LFVSATPGPYEIQLSDHVVQQLIRPTWLLDPYTFIYPKSGAYQPLVKSVEALLKKKPQLKKYLNGYQDHINFEEVFHGVEES
jgi:excinuclease ABC subunit B